MRHNDQRILVIDLLSIFTDGHSNVLRFISLRRIWSSTKKSEDCLFNVSWKSDQH